jgi:hypothetical protein
LHDVLAVPGFVSAQRFSLTGTLTNGPPYKYLAIYDVESEDLGAVLQALESHYVSGTMYISDAMDKNIYAMLYRPIAPVVREEEGSSPLDSRRLLRGIRPRNSNENYEKCSRVALSKV